MLTIDALKEIGVKPEDGLKRCLNNEDFYLKLVKMVPEDQGFQKLQDSLAAQDLDGAFEAAHALRSPNCSVTAPRWIIPNCCRRSWSKRRHWMLFVNKRRRN